MRYGFRYNVGPMYADRPFGGTGGGLLSTILGVVWTVVAFVVQLVVWAVLLVVGFFYTLIWAVVWLFNRLFGRTAAAGDERLPELVGVAVGAGDGGDEGRRPAHPGRAGCV
jgi:hypothetical protein